jgi:micrococcal nuclease
MIKNKKAAIIAVIVVVIVLVVCIVWFVVRASSGNDPVIDSQIYYPVTYVVDGDTFKVDVGGSANPNASRTSKIITIRVLGINTPETVDPRKPIECYGPEASAKGKELLADRKVRLVFSPNREVKDKYGRYLAYAYRDDGLFYNEEMIKDGYAYEYTVGSAYSMQKDFRAAQSVAQKAKLGLWSACVKK